MSKKKEMATPLPAQEPKKERLSLDGNYPGLNEISWFIGYLEQFLAIISEPLLIACAAIAVVDFMTGGRLLQLPVLNYTWAGSLAIAVTACFIVTWRRAIKAFTLNRYGVSIGLTLLGIILGIVDFAAIAVQALQQTLNISFVQALALLNLNVVVITYIRAGVTIAMAVVVALSNHTAVTTASAPKRRLAFLDKALNKIAPVVSDETAQPLAHEVSTPEAKQEIEQVAAIGSARLHIVGTNPVQPHLDAPPLERVRQVLGSEPDCSDRRLGKLSGMSAATAKKYRSLLEQERSQVSRS